jgi:hypothetical protein
MCGARRPETVKHRMPGAQATLPPLGIPSCISHNRIKGAAATAL